MFFSDDEAEKGSRNSPRVLDNRMMIAPKDVLLACDLAMQNIEIIPRRRSRIQGPIRQMRTRQ